MMIKFLNLEADECPHCGSDQVAKTKLTRKQHIVTKDHLLVIRKFGNGDEIKFWREVFGDKREMDAETKKRYLTTLFTHDPEKFEKKGKLKKEFENILNF